MHKTTKEQLETVARWTADIVRADSVATELDSVMIEQTDERDTWSSISNHFGNLAVGVHDATSVGDATPILRKLRRAGFRRERKPEQNATAGTVEWTYARGSYSDDDRTTVTVKLTLKKATAGAAEPTCQYVQVGMKEVPDVRLMCGDELARWRESQRVEA